MLSTVKPAAGQLQQVYTVFELEKRSAFLQELENMHVT